MAHTDKELNPVDQHVGRRMMERRLALGFTQQTLAVAMGVSFQQLQKYEKGLNRISASRLWEAAQFLSVDPNYFYGGMTFAAVGTTGIITRHTAAISEMAPKLPVKSQRLVEGLMREILAPAD